ncbi:MAG: glutamyl-tRNA reductase [Planctomycetes bacterium]|nr:glutamyl-tRNA reductase [Planctomycetota bacterium]
MKLVLNSTTHNNCPVAQREKLSLTDEHIKTMLKAMHEKPGINEAAILKTCNRLEFYIYAKKEFDCDGFLRELLQQVNPQGSDCWKKFSKNMRDIDAVRHLFQVSAGLDSQMLGENQILSQVKEAYSISTHYKMSRFVFHRLFHNAFRVGKMVRSSTDINCGAVSISLAAVELAKKELDLKNCCAVMVGAGENAELAAKYLCKAGLGKLRVVNRNIENAQVLCESLNTGTTAPLEELYDEIAAADLVICSTAAQEFVVSYDKLKNQLDSRDRPLVIIDIAVPRDVEPEVGDIGCVKLYNIDDLDERICINRQKRANEVPKANEIVDEYTDKFFKWYDGLKIVPIISNLHQQGYELAIAEVERYAKDFPSGDRERLELFAQSLVKKVLHGPVSFLKSSGEDELTEEQMVALDYINKMFFSQGRQG